MTKKKKKYKIILFLKSISYSKYIYIYIYSQTKTYFCYFNIAFEMSCTIVFLVFGVCGRGKIRVRNRAHGPSPRRGKGPPTHQPWSNTWMRIQGGTTKRPTFWGAWASSVPRELLGRPFALDNRIPKKTVKTCMQRRRKVSRQNNHHLRIQCIAPTQLATLLEE